MRALAFFQQSAKSICAWSTWSPLERRRGPSTLLLPQNHFYICLGWFGLWAMGEIISSKKSKPRFDFFKFAVIGREMNNAPWGLGGKGIMMKNPRLGGEN
ncbi:hypothetical protein I7I53_06135 [Histoplasma capsulatum var. duboisii H88]|uniref:Uncharacterized protein n=1 Tax=Ajellomyces capsulatus (strain H88) TaxID=544711 RepID=A0A8A1LB80_AJEC8|nr:hypothetical protein I7I53_06135 [Histoplasma capsulatum var. duboisii H88]